MNLSIKKETKMVNFNYNYKNDYPDESPRVDFEEACKKFSDNNLDSYLSILDDTLCFKLYHFDGENSLTYDIVENELELSHEQILKLFNSRSYLSDLFDKFGEFKWELQKGFVLELIFKESFSHCL